MDKIYYSTSYRVCKMWSTKHRKYIYYGDMTFYYSYGHSFMFELWPIQQYGHSDSQRIWNYTWGESDEG